MRLHLALSLLLLASLLPALPSATAATAAAEALPASASGETCYASAIASAEVCVYEHWSTGDTCVAVHRGEWVHATRCAPVDYPRCPGGPLDAVDLPCSAPAADAGPTVCTYHLVESVAVCVGTDGCVTVFLGPSARTVCARELVDDPYVCTTQLIESVSVCENDAGCLALYLGPSEHPLCVAATADASSAEGCTWAGPAGVCRDGSLARGCAGAYYGEHEIYHACWAEAAAPAAAPALDGCVPDPVEVVDVCLEGVCPVVWLGPGAVRPCHAIDVTQCVYDDGRSRVCWENGADGLCVYGNVAHPSFRQCVGRIATLSAASGADGAGSCVEPVTNLKVCRYTNDQGDSCVRVEASYSSWEQCFSPRAAPASASVPCQDPMPGTSLCVYENERGETCVGPMLGNQPFEQCAPSLRVATGLSKACAPGEVFCAWTSNGEVCTSSRSGNLEDPAVRCQRVLP